MGEGEGLGTEEGELLGLADGPPGSGPVRVWVPHEVASRATPTARARHRGRPPRACGTAGAGASPFVGCEHLTCATVVGGRRVSAFSVESMSAHRSPDVVLCRGCCCGTVAKHADVDHAAQRQTLGLAVRAAGGRLVIADCLDACERSNVVVVRPRGRGTPRPVWLGEVLTPERTAAVARWVAAGGPGQAPLPAALDGCVFVPGRHSREELAEVQDRGARVARHAARVR